MTYRVAEKSPSPDQYATIIWFGLLTHTWLLVQWLLGRLATVSKIVHTWFAAATEFSCVIRMADTSSYTIEERLVASVWVMAAFRERFNKAPPRKATLRDWEKRAFALGSAPGPLYPRERNPVPIVQETGWAPGPAWKGAENLAHTGIDSRTVQALASRYTHYAIAAH